MLSLAVPQQVFLFMPASKQLPRVCGSMHACAHVVQADELKAQVARVTGIPVDKLIVIYRGTTLVASDARVPLSDGGDT